MNITPKSPENVQFQIAGFARTLPTTERRFVFKNMLEIAGGEPEDATGEISESPYFHPEIKTPVHVAYEDYLKYFRETVVFDPEVLAQRALLDNYPDFKSDIATLLDELPDEHPQSPNYLGRGASAEAFTFEKNGIEYVVRVAFNKNFREAHETIDHHLRGAVRGIGIPHLEQVIALSYEHGTTVAERIQGKPFARMNIDEIHAMPEEHIWQLMKTAKMAADANIRLDLNGENVLYDARHGFGIIDYTASDEPQSASSPVYKMVKALHSTSPRDPPVEFPTESHQESALLMMRVRESLKNKNSGLNDTERMFAIQAATKSIEYDTAQLTSLNAEIILPKKEKRSFHWLHSFVSIQK